jgi:beta-lactamase regulating signal transducer with metallopeptidase domain
MTGTWFAAPQTGNLVWVLAVDMIVKLTILILLACATHALLGRRRVLVRSGLWNAVLLAAILQPAAALGLPRLRIACLSAPDVSATTAEALVPVSEPPNSRLRDVSGSPQTPVVVVTDPLRPGSRWLGESRGNLAPVLPVLTGIYAVGVMILFVRLMASLAAVGRLKRTAVVVDNPAWTGPLSRWRDRLGIARPVLLVQSGCVRVPMVLGWLRPAIVLPVTEEEDSPGSQVDAILLHELAHLRRGDDLWNLVQQVVQILYWPHPLSWMAARLIAGVREQACDDLCVRWVGGARDYHAALVTVASRLVPRPIPSVPTSLGMAMARASSSALLRRLSWIEQTQGASACLLSWPGRLAIAGVVLGLAFVMCTIELTRVRAAQSVVTSDPVQKISADGSALVRAYDVPVPVSAKFHTATLIVLDDETDKPLAGVDVMLLNYVDLKYHTFPTDSNGRLRFEYPYNGAKPVLNLEVRKNGCVPVRHAWGFDDGPDQPADAVTIRLRRGTTMGGIVVYAADQPVEGVTVVMTVSKYGPGKRPNNPVGYEMYYEIPSRTGPDGRWRTDSVPPGVEEVHLQLIHPDFVSDGSTTLGASGRSPKLAALRDQSDRQVLTKGVKISGRVVDARGKPIPGAKVVDSTKGLTFLTYVRHAFTDPDGRFHFHLPRNGDLTLTVQVKGYQPATVKVAAEPHTHTPPIEIRLAPGRTLRGQIVDPQGKPIAGASLMIPSYSRHKGILFRKWADAQGRFEWDSAPEESVEFRIGAEGYVSIDPISLTASDKEAVIVLKPAVDVRLRVVDAGTGKPIPRFGIQTGRADKGSQDFRWGGAMGAHEGDYHTTLEAEDGPYQIKVFADGYAEARTRIFRGEEKTVRAVIRLMKKEK